MIIPCGCGRNRQWEIHRVGSIALLCTRCLTCDPSGRFDSEPVDVLRKPRGRMPDDLPLAWAPVDTSEI